MVQVSIRSWRLGIQIIYSVLFVVDWFSLRLWMEKSFEICSNLFWHTNIWSYYKRQICKICWHALSHWWHHGTSHWILHHQWCGDSLLHWNIYLEYCTEEKESQMKINKVNFSFTKCYNWISNELHRIHSVALLVYIFYWLH